MDASSSRRRFTPKPPPLPISRQRKKTWQEACLSWDNPTSRRRGSRPAAAEIFSRRSRKAGLDCRENALLIQALASLQDWLPCVRHCPWWSGPALRKPMAMCIARRPLKLKRPSRMLAPPNRRPSGGAMRPLRLYARWRFAQLSLPLMRRSARRQQKAARLRHSAWLRCIARVSRLLTTPDGMAGAVRVGAYAAWLSWASVADADEMAAMMAAAVSAGVSDGPGMRCTFGATGRSTSWSCPASSVRSPAAAAA